MNVNKLCLCCNTESLFYQNSVTKKVAAYCLECNSKFSPAQKKLRETNNILKILLQSKDINEKCTRL